MVKMRFIIPVIALFLVNFAVERGVWQNLRPPAEEASGSIAENRGGFYLTGILLLTDHQPSFPGIRFSAGEAISPGKSSFTAFRG
jgi:hypothetical protein